MQPFRRILHPTDFSDCAGVALTYALDLAVRTGAELEVLHIVEDEERYTGNVPLAELEQESLQIRLKEKTIERFSGLHRADLTALQLEYTLAGGKHPAQAVLEHLDRNPKDLVVMGTHGRRGVRRLLLGSVAEEVIQDAPCPVCTVRHCGQEGAVEITRILVPIDFSEPSARVLKCARLLAARYEAALVLLFVAEEHIVPHFSDTGIPTFAVIKMEEEVIGRAEAALRQLHERTLGKGHQTRYEVRRGRAGRTILALAQEQRADLIVMATRGISGHTHSLLGSVANHVVRAARCPVLTIKGAGEMG